MASDIIPIMDDGRIPGTRLSSCPGACLENPGRRSAMNGCVATLSSSRRAPDGSLRSAPWRESARPLLHCVWPRKGSRSSPRSGPQRGIDAPLALDPDVGLVPAPTVGGRFESTAQTSFHFRGVTLYPSPHHDLIGVHAPLGQQLLRITALRACLKSHDLVNRLSMRRIAIRSISVSEVCTRCS